MQTTETVEVRVDDLERGGCGVGNGLDSGRSGVFVDNIDKHVYRDVLLFQVLLLLLLLKPTPQWNSGI